MYVINSVFVANITNKTECMDVKRNFTKVCKLLFENWLFESS